MVLQNVFTVWKPDKKDEQDRTKPVCIQKIFWPALLDMKAKAGYLPSCTKNYDAGSTQGDVSLHSAEGLFQATPVSVPSASNHPTGGRGVQNDR